MKRSKISQVVTAIIMTGTAAVPLGTTYEILTHLPTNGATPALAAAPSSVSAARKPAAITAPSVGDDEDDAAASSAASSPPPASASSAAFSAPPTSTSGQRFTGPSVQDQWGSVQALISVKNKRIIDASISAPMDNPRSAGINSQAVPILRSETLQAQSASGVNAISGATLTSGAYQQSLQAAISQAQQAKAL